MRALVIEDDPMVASGLIEALQKSRLQVDHAPDAGSGAAAARDIAYDIAIIDINLPDFDGLEVVRRIRQHGRPMPILILSARAGLGDRVAGLDLGADDYLTKPFEIAELLARVRALVRRASSTAQPELRIGNLTIDMACHTVRADGIGLDLTKREWDILESLALAAPKVVPKTLLVERMGNWDNELTPNAIEVQISRLRSKLSGCGVNIRTIRGLGYRLDEIS